MAVTPHRKEYMSRSNNVSGSVCSTEQESYFLKFTGSTIIHLNMIKGSFEYNVVLGVNTPLKGNVILFVDKHCVHVCAGVSICACVHACVHLCVRQWVYG